MRRPTASAGRVLARPSSQRPQLKRDPLGSNEDSERPLSKRGKKLRQDLAQFLKQYARKAPKKGEPNDRRYDRKIEAIVKRLRPEDLDMLLGKDEE